MHDLLNVDPKSGIHQITLVRCGYGSSIKLFQYSAPDQKNMTPKNSDIGGYHIAFYVDDIKAAKDYLDSKGVKTFFTLPVGGCTQRRRQGRVLFTRAFPECSLTSTSPSKLDSAAHSLEEFKALPNLRTVLNVEPTVALEDFATADVLILSCSCLGYVGGLLNPHGLVIAAPNLPPPRNFHTALPDWLVANEQGGVDATQLSARVAGLLRDR
jgi:catechol 2,3-dioxygenase-like lactoylglutathione lyase family enzyme